MNIAISINTSWNVYNFRKGLVKKLLDEGHNVFVFCPRDTYSQKLEQLGCTFVPISIDNKGYNPLKDFKLISTYVRLLKQHKINYLLTFTIKPNIYGSLASIFTKARVIANVSGLGTVFINSGFKANFARKLYTLGLKKAHFVFFQNSDDLRLITNLANLPSDKTGLLPGSGINTKEIPQSPLNTQSKQFIVIARTLFAKGIKEFIRAASNLKEKHPDYRFLWIGLDEKNNELGYSKEKLINKNINPSVRYKPFTDNILDEVKNSLCAVLPSYREGTPRSLLEAMSLGLPIATTNVPGCKDLVRNNGFLFEAQSSDSIENALEKIIKSSENELIKMGNESRKIVEKFYEEEIVISKYLKQITA